MSNQPDISVFSPDNKLKLVVEVKGNRGANAEWASQFRRNLMAHEAIPRSPFFLLALPDRLYLWENGSEVIDLRKPDFEVDSSPILGPYLESSPESLNNNTSNSLELILASWLTLLTISHISNDEVASHERWLLESGLYEAIKNGSVKTEASS